MAQLSFRDRFFSPPVARALTSPSGILSLGAGAAVGIVATAPLSVPLAVVGAVVGGALGLGGRLAAALPKKGSGPKVDPFSVDEPWRAEVLDAVRARARFGEALRTFQSGPLKESVQQLDAQLDEALTEVWEVAQQGHLIADARKRIDTRQIDSELKVLANQVGDGTPSELQASTKASLDAQRESATRMDALIARTRDELGLLNARLDETVTQAIELSVTNRGSGLAPLGASVDAIVDDLTALREAMGDLDT